MVLTGRNCLYADNDNIKIHMRKLHKIHQINA